MLKNIVLSSRGLAPQLTASRSFAQKSLLKDIADVVTGQTSPTEFVNEELERAKTELQSVLSSKGITSLRQLNVLRDSDSTFKTLLDTFHRHEGASRKGSPQNDLLLAYTSPKSLKPPVTVTVTGASGAIGYALVFRIASGEMLGKDQPVRLNLLELPGALQSLNGVVMELKDCAFPLVTGILATDSVEKAFEGADYALLVGAKPRSKGMERGDLLKANGAIFSVQGKALSDNANSNCKVLVVGNPANTNAYIAAHNAPKLNPENFFAMTKLDHNRGLAQIAEKTGKPVTSIKRFAIWGNHSATQYPDVSHTQIDEKWAKEILDQEWIEKSFIPRVQQRGAEIIATRGSSSAASAAGSAIDHFRELSLGSNGDWTSFAVASDGSYGVPRGLYFSYPVIASNGSYDIVQNVPIDEFSARRLEITTKELLAERDAVTEYVKKN